MRRTAVVVGLTLGLLTAAGSASADGGLANPGQFIVSGDRLFSVFSYQDAKTGPDNATTSSSSTQIGLFSGIPGASTAPSTVFNVSRLALDYTVTPNITVGGSIFVMATLGSSTTVTQGTMSVSNPGDKLTYWGIAPRAGYIFPITDQFSFWGRLGISYIAGTVSSSNTTTAGNGTMTTTSTSTTLSEFALDLEPMFVFSPVNHFGFVFGPTVDVPLTGSLSSGGQSVSASQVYIGVQAGILGYF